MRRGRHLSGVQGLPAMLQKKKQTVIGSRPQVHELSQARVVLFAMRGFSERCLSRSRQRQTFEHQYHRREVTAVDTPRAAKLLD